MTLPEVRNVSERRGEVLVAGSHAAYNQTERSGSLHIQMFVCIQVCTTLTPCPVAPARHTAVCQKPHPGNFLNLQKVPFPCVKQSSQAEPYMYMKRSGRRDFSPQPPSILMFTISGRLFPRQAPRGL